MHSQIRTLNTMHFLAVLVTFWTVLFGVASASPVFARDESPGDNSTASATLLSTASEPSTSATTMMASPEATAVATATMDDPSDLVTTSVLSATSTALATGSPNSDFPLCTSQIADHSPYPPFCEPQNGSTKYVGSSYYVTWDPTSFNSNSTITILLNYINATGPAAQNAWISPPTPKNLGFVIMTMDGDWLQGQNSNNLSLSLTALNPSVDRPAAIEPGPIIMLTNEPAQHYPPPPHTTINKLGLEVGIPVGLAAFFFILCGLWFGMRKTRRIELGNVMGRRKGYGVGKSRRQRVGKRGIQLQETELRSGSPDFRDDPDEDRDAPPRLPSHARDVSLGSLVSSPAQSISDQRRGGGNVFREEISRQYPGAR